MDKELSTALKGSVLWERLTDTLQEYQSNERSMYDQEMYSWFNVDELLDDPRHGQAASLNAER